MVKIQFKDGRAEPLLIMAPGRTIGRDDVNDIVIDVDGVNGFHADLRVDGDTVTITDVKTPSGTFVNGERISTPTTLRLGDVVSVGGVELEIISAESDAGKTLVLSGAALLEAGGGWCLKADSGIEKGQIIPLSGLMEVGRALECDISILEPSLSRKHAEFEVRNGDLMLTDLGSSNGTYVNGEKVQEIQLSDKDVIQFQNVRFTVIAP
jgi:pSer/pThr/pTyr-binding forkhead associated (FHA) protein